ncbi:oryzin precursor [Cordyceps militaris]|uniref:Oryzin n=1 Tax=Cordyceps militaris TaxID=73501 RepID=A0A2H4SMI9_CORMI|nr:oryzin precursor [Cordyceps militaris]
MRLSIIAAVLPLAVAGPVVGPAPLIQARGSQGVDGKYIVKFKDSAAVSIQDVQSKVAKTDHVYENVIKGFSASLTQDQVEYIEQDAIVSINTMIEQRDVPWGLARISHRQRGNTSYIYHRSAGRGVCAYVIDTGIFDKHPDFGQRAQQIKTFAGDETQDGNGHGTHCAGIIGSSTYGVAKKVSIFGVKVLGDDGTGLISTVIAGIEFVASDRHSRDCPSGVVVNMSFGSGYSATLNQAATRLQSSGCFVAAAAGNSNADANTFSPASAPSICAVGATDSEDRRSPFSNFGSVVGIFAPGSDILSTWNDGQAKLLSGTSAATPHIAGLGAYLLSLHHVKAWEVCSRIQTLSTKKVLSDVPEGTQNYLAFNGATD